MTSTMKHQATRWIVFTLIGLCWGFLGTACKKQAASTAGSAGSYQQLPEVTNVFAALNQKNYDEAVSELVKLKQSVSTEQQQNEYALLTREVKDKLLDASPSDPKAAEALQTYRLLTTGR